MRRKVKFINKVIGAGVFTILMCDDRSTISRSVRVHAHGNPYRINMICVERDDSEGAMEKEVLK